MRRAALASVVLGMNLVPAAWGAERTWLNGGGGLFHTGANWSGAAAPGPADTALFNLDDPGYVVTFSTGTTNLGMTVRDDVVVMNLVGVTYTLTTNSPGLTLGDTAGGFGRLTLNGGSLNASAVTLGSVANSLGAATLGSGATLTTTAPLVVGLQGLASLNVLAGARLNTNANFVLANGSLAIGQMTINGAGASWVAGPGFSPGVANQGLGNLLVLGGGTMSAPGVVLASSASSSGNMTVSGLGSSATLTDFAFIGSGGQGTLIANSSAAISGTNFLVANSAGSSGTMSVGSSASLSATQSISIGVFGAGTMAIGPLGRVTSGNIALAFDGASTASVSINAGSWSNGTVATIASNGAATMNISGGGSLSTGFSNLAVGPLGRANVQVSSGGRFINTGSISIGGGGIATVTISGGGSFSAGAAVLGGEATGSGEVNVTNFNSSFTLTGPITIGSQGRGVMRVSSTGDVISAGATIADANDSAGTALVQGTGSTWANGGALNIGLSGIASMEVLSGGFVTTSGVNVGALVGSSGSLLITGGTSAVNSSASVYVGGISGGTGGSGFIGVGPGGRLGVSSLSLLRIYGTGSVNLDGGTISTGSLEIPVASGGAFNFNSGTLIITGAAGALIGPAGLFGPSVQLDSGMSLVVSQTATVQAGTYIAIDGGTINAATFTNNGEVQFLSRSGLLGSSSSRTTNNGLISGNGRINGPFFNNPGGEVRVSGGEHISVAASGTLGSSNTGQINLFGGIIEFDQAVVNSGTGRITGRGTVIASGGLSLAGGTMSLSGGFTDVLGPITNSALLMVTGGSTSTFFDNVTNNPGSELRVSTNSTAVFLGAVSGLSAFTGTGTAIFEGSASFDGLARSGTTVVEPSGSLEADHIRENVLIVRGKVTITPKAIANDPTGTSVVQSLTIDSAGRLDLTNNSMIIDYDAPIGTLVDDLRQHLQSGRMTSSAATLLTGLGYGDNALLNKSTFAGQLVDVSSLLIKFTYCGDTDLDGDVDVADLGALATNWQTTNGWTGGDFDYNGSVDVNDLGLLASNWQAGVGSPLGPGLAEALSNFGLPNVSVPEPACLTSVGLLVTWSLKRPRRC